MIYYDGTDISEELDVNKSSKSKEYDICYHWYFLNKGFNFQPNVRNGCHDLSMISMNLNSITLLNVKCFDYCCIITEISKDEA